MKLRVAAIVIIVGCLFLSAPAAQADPIVWVTSSAALGPDGTVDFVGAFGAEPATISSGSAAGVPGLPGLSLTFSSATGESMMRLDQSSGWAGNFLPGTPLLYTYGTSPQGTWIPNGPMTIDSNQPLEGIGFQIQADMYGSFTASLCAYDSNDALLGCHNFAGTSNGNADGSAIFVGVYDSEGRIASVVVDTESSSFAISQPQVVRTAEPGTFTMLGAALFGLAAVLRKRSFRLSS